MIRVGAHLKPLPPMRNSRQIVIDALASIKGGVELHGGHVYGLTDFRPPEGQNRLCEAFAVLAHLAADRNPNAMKAVFDAKTRDAKATERLVNRIMDLITECRDQTRSDGNVFTVSDIRPILEKALS